MVKNVAQLVINRDRTGTESLRKGDLLPKNLFDYERYNAQSIENIFKAE